MASNRLNLFLFVIKIYDLGGGFEYFVFSPLFGEDSQFDYIII